MLTADDRLAIHELLYRYCIYTDDNDMENWVELFKPDGQWFGQSGSLRSAQDFENRKRRKKASVQKLSRHSVNNVIIEEIGSEGNLAKVRADVMVVKADAPDSNSARVIYMGTYFDEVRKVDGRWRFRERHIDRDGVFYAAPELREVFNSGASGAETR